MNGFSIDQFVGDSDVSKSNESNIAIYETLKKRQKDHTVENYDGNRSQREDPIYQDIDGNLDHEIANQESNQNIHSDGKVQNYTSTNLTFTEPYQTLQSSFKNQVNEQESGNKTNNDHYASLTGTKEKPCEHLPKSDPQNDDKTSSQLKPKTTHEESGSASPPYKTLETFDFDGVHS